MGFNKKTVIRSLAAFVFLVALTAIFGWTFNVVPFISIIPGMTAMNPMTATSFLLISTWLLVRSSKVSDADKKILELVIALPVFFVGFMKLMEYADISHLEIDQLLFREKLSKRPLHNAIAPTAALLFLFTGILQLNSNKTNRAKKIINDVFLLAGFLVSYLAIIGYVYSLDSYYRIGPFVPMALNTALCFFAAYLALFLALPAGNFSAVFFSGHIGGRLMRKVIPFVLLLPPVFGYSRLLLRRAQFYNVEYSLVLDTVFIALVGLLLIFFYANVLNKKDRERKQAEKVVAESEEKYRSLVYALKEGIIYYDKKGRILFYNPGFSEMTGYAQDELIGKNILETLVGEEHDVTTDEHMADMPVDVWQGYESCLMHKDGTKIMVEITSRPIIKDGETDSFLSTFIDITERKKREEDIAAFSESAAHDLNAPLARVETLANYIMEFSKAHLSEEDMEHLGVVMKTTADMRALLRDLLLFSRVGKEKVKKMPINTNEMVRAIIATASNTTAKINVEDLPVSYGDPSAIRQVWVNLISNAIKYSSKKDKAEVSIGVDKLNNKHVYYVKDNGAGFDMNESWKLFAPFKRLHNDFEGTGLGLPIVKRIIEKHGGRIWAEGEMNKGASFYFII